MHTPLPQDLRCTRPVLTELRSAGYIGAYQSGRTWCVVRIDPAHVAVTYADALGPWTEPEHYDLPDWQPTHPTPAARARLLVERLARAHRRSRRWS